MDHLEAKTKDRAAIEHELLDAARQGAEAVLGTNAVIRVAFGPADQVQVFEGEVRRRPQFEPHLGWALTQSLNEVLLRDLPGPEFPPGTLGHFLQSGGGWSQGRTATSGAVTVSVKAGFLDIYRTDVDNGRVCYGFEVANGTDRVNEPIDSADENSLAAWAWRRVNSTPSPQFDELLCAMAEKIAAGERYSEGKLLDALLGAVLPPPVAGGLWDWLPPTMQASLCGPLLQVRVDGHLLHFEIRRVSAPSRSLREWGRVTVTLWATKDGLAVCPDGWVFHVGRLGYDTVDREVPSPGQQDDIEGLLATFRMWFAMHVEHHLAIHGGEELDSPEAFHLWNQQFEVVSLIQHRLVDGPPGPPPVAPFDEAAIDRAARIQRLSKPAPGALPHILEAYVVDGWEVHLLNRTDEVAHGPSCGIQLLPPDQGGHAHVLMVNLWHCPAREVVDGDAFALRRFLEWLRGGIIRSGQDPTHAFADGQTLNVSEWLQFGLPDTGDRFLVDWRYQWHVAPCGDGIKAFASVYALSAQALDELETFHIVQWRRFLREVVDPRFGKNVV